MKIAIDARMYGTKQFSGIGTYIQRLTDEIFQLDQENQYIMFMREPAFSKFKVPNERVKKVLVKSRHYSYDEQFKLPFEFMKEKFDLIHYPHFNSPILYPKKSVCTIHDITPLFFPGHKMKSIVRRIGYKAVFSGTLRKAKHVIAVSNSTKLDIVKHLNIKSKKISVVYEGVDESFRKIDDYGIINKTKKQFGITKPYLFYVGVWRSHKNIEGLVKAFDLLKKKYKLDYQLVLGGREDLHYTKVREIINCSPFKQDIITTGYVQKSELPILYNAAELFVLPSFIEGFGLICIEAQACGTPVVSTNTSSMPEVLGDSALFFDPKDENEMADKIHQILSNQNLKQKLITKGFYNVTRFSWKKCALETLRIYKQIHGNT
ncbi:glycosyltransferase family 4 protein [Candidatus Kuenenbacteria bacterium]|nr:glycosyltransferase family 4 protein [Candidatus Kuenenbacteria bacterium]